MHRKIVVVDGELAFVGGINYSADHLADFGPEAKQDYAVEIAGPLVAEIHRFVPHGAGRRASAPAAAQLVAQPQPPARPARRRQPRRRRGRGACSSRATTAATPNDIERHYRAAIRAARKRIVIANAYFFPGYRLHARSCAARRGAASTCA